VPFFRCLRFLDLPLFRRYRAFKMAATRTVSQNAAPPTLQNTALLSSARSLAQMRTSAVEASAPESGPSFMPRWYFDALFAACGPQHWWPGRTRFEIMVGAILTQNTSWSNVERAIGNLRGARMLSPQAIRRVRAARLARLLRPSGYFRQKTKTLKSFVNFLFDSYGGSLSRLFATPTTVLRERLLELRGVGPETADSILLYAGKHPVFVVDAYTRRILERHGHTHRELSYDEIRKMFESALPAEHQLFNEFHALIVHVGKNFCHKTSPCCSHCPLNRFLPVTLDPGSIGDFLQAGSPVISHQSAVTRP
jgi:endonuclease-3 related protein